VANPRYHGKGPYLQSLIQKVVPDQQVLYVQFQTGEVTIYDLQGIPPELYSRAKAMSFNFIGDGLRDALDPRLKI
jgi:peptide/nickel transport system substrate-binding protein